MAAGTTATRADELSDLVAAISGSEQAKRIASDTRVLKYDSLPRYKAKKHIDIDESFLDAIYKSMRREKRAVAAHLNHSDIGHYNTSEYWEERPTLGRQDFYRPVPGVITSHYGWRQQFGRMHHGIDLSLHVGDTVRAAVSGTISLISYDADGYGNYIIVDNQGDMQTVYGHLQYALVAQGQDVEAGQAIAIGGNTGNSTGPHLHFETRLGEHAVDPTLLFDFYGNFNYAYDKPTPSTKGPVYSHQASSLSGQTTYIVRYGDTLASIARQAGVSVMRLCQLNMLQESSPLEVGRMIKLK